MCVCVCVCAGLGVKVGDEKEIFAYPARIVSSAVTAPPFCATHIHQHILLRLCNLRSPTVMALNMGNYSCDRPYLAANK